MPSLETFMGGVFEEICKDYLWQKYDSLPVQFERACRWWGANPHKKQTEEIDIVAANEEEAIFCECKWRNKEVTEDVLEKLVERSRLVPVKKRYYILFAKKAFSERCRAAAEEKGIRLINFKELCVNIKQ